MIQCFQIVKICILRSDTKYSEQADHWAEAANLENIQKFGIPQSEKLKNTPKMKTIQWNRLILTSFSSKIQFCHRFGEKKKTVDESGDVKKKALVYQKDYAFTVWKKNENFWNYQFDNWFLKILASFWQKIEFPLGAVFFSIRISARHKSDLEAFWPISPFGLTFGKYKLLIANYIFQGWVTQVCILEISSDPSPLRVTRVTPF